jgi:nicotinamidase-related amidase
MTKSNNRLRPSNSVLIVIDIQDKLLPKIGRAEEVVRNAGFLIDAAALLEVPIKATEQYPK